MDVDGLLLVSKLKKSSILAKYVGNFSFIIKTKSSLCPFSSSLPFCKFRKQNFMYFGYKLVKTGSNFHMNFSKVSHALNLNFKGM